MRIEAKSVITATVYLRTPGLYSDIAKTTPKKILAEARSKEFRDEFTDFIRRMEKEGKGWLVYRAIQEGYPLLDFIQQSRREAQGEHQRKF